VARWDAAALQKSYMLRYNMLRERIELIVSDYGDEERTVLSFPWEPNYNHFDYIRVDRLHSGWWVLRINGIVRATARDFLPVHQSTAPCTVGCVLNPVVDEGPFRGNIDSIRITAGVARDDTFDTLVVPQPYSLLAETGVAANPSMLVPTAAAMVL
jgi:hypothetical protein